MKIILCLDQNGGMLFNRRRQSRDRNVISDIEALIGTDTLYIHPYSKTLFSKSVISTDISEDFLSKAGESDFCFTEKSTLAEFADDITELIIYRWNRIYPADVYIDIDPHTVSAKPEITEFKGYSHEIITKEVYRK